MFVKRVFSRVGVRNSLLISEQFIPVLNFQTIFLFCPLVFGGTDSSFDPKTSVIAAETAYYWKRERTRAEAQETNDQKLDLEFRAVVSYPKDNAVLSTEKKGTWAELSTTQNPSPQFLKIDLELEVRPEASDADVQEYIEAAQEIFNEQGKVYCEVESRNGKRYFVFRLDSDIIWPPLAAIAVIAPDFQASYIKHPGTANFEFSSSIHPDMVGHLAPDEEAAIQAGEFFSAIESIRVLAEMKAHKIPYGFIFSEPNPVLEPKGYATFGVMNRQLSIRSSLNWTDLLVEPKTE